MIFRFVLEPGGTSVERALVIGDLVEMLVIRDLAWLAGHPELPLLSDYPITYVADPSTWRDIPSVIREGRGDCKDLAAWRIAELRFRGEGAQVHVEIHDESLGEDVYHVAVRRPGGVVEDPARQKGMREVEMGRFAKRGQVS